MKGQCEHKAPEKYCPICNTEEEIESHFDEILDCTCFDGYEYDLWPDGEYSESICIRCNGTGILDSVQSLGLHRLLKIYWAKKIKGDR